MENRMLLGKIIQVHSSLDYGDGVSKQIISLHNLFIKLGFVSKIYVKYFDSRVAEFISPLDECRADAADLVIFHYSGYSQLYDEFFMGNSARILLYHNITPHDFFDIGSKLYDQCKKGREQLSGMVSYFHYFIGDSQYNLEELISLGAPREKGYVWPIIVNHSVSSELYSVKAKKNIIFIGRLSPNKRQDNLVKLFVDYCNRFNDQTSNLILIGDDNQNKNYSAVIYETINKLQISGRVIITGKISDFDFHLYVDNALVYVSVSEHEGFGIPLIEAMHSNIPVLALSNTAITETIADSDGLCRDCDELINKINRVKTDCNFVKKLLSQQADIIKRYTESRVKNAVMNFFHDILPQLNKYKTVSIIICTYNRRELLARCLDYLRYQTNSNFEVIVVNGPSNDGTMELLKEYNGKIKIGYNSQKNLSVSRNIGINLAAGDIVAFIDDDSIPFYNWVERILFSINRIPEIVAGAGGPVYYAGSLDFQVQDIGCNVFADTTPNITNRQWSNNLFRTCIGTNSYFKKHALTSIGGFDEEYDYFLDETDVCFRVYKTINGIMFYDNELYLRHEFAISHNRSNKYDYNWYAINKNTAFFIAKANHGRPDIELTVKHKLEEQWFIKLRGALESGEITKQKFDIYSKQIWDGCTAGLSAAKEPRKLFSAFQTITDSFLSYTNNRDVRLIMLHIVLLTNEFPPFVGNGGIGTLYYNLASELLLMGHKVSVVCQSDKNNIYRRGNFQLIEQINEKHINIDCGNSIFERIFNWSLIARDLIIDLNDNYCKVDMVDTCIWDSPAFALCTTKDYGIKICTRLVSPLKVATQINNWQINEIDYNLMVKSEEYLIDNSDIVIPISHSIQKTILEQYDVEKNGNWHHAYIGIAYWPSYDVNHGYNSLTGKIKSLNKIPSKNKKLLFIGRLEPRKGFDTLLAALDIVFKLENDISAIIVGKDGNNYLESDIFKKYNGSKIIYLGELSNAFKDTVINSADIVVFPSRYESFGIVALEAFVHAKPVIGCRAGAIPEVVEDKVSGLLFEPENIDDLAKQIIELSTNTSLYKELSENARGMIHKFSSRNMAFSSYELYLDALT